MKVSCDPGRLQRALELIARYRSPYQHVAATEMVLMEAGRRLSLAVNGHRYQALAMVDAEITEQGRCLADPKRLVTMLQGLKDKVRLDADDRGTLKLVTKSGRKMSLEAPSSSTFPALQKPPDVSFALTGLEFMAAAPVLKLVDSELGYVQLERDSENQLRCTVTDQQIISTLSLRVGNPLPEDFGVWYVPGQLFDFAQQSIRALDLALDKPVFRLASNVESYSMITGNDGMLRIVRLQQESPIRWRPFLERPPLCEVQCQAEELAQVLTKAESLAEVATLSIVDSTLHLAAQSPQTGALDWEFEQVPEAPAVEAPPSPVCVPINSLRIAVSTLKGALAIGFRSPREPMMIRPVQMGDINGDLMMVASTRMPA